MENKDLKSMSNSEIMKYKSSLEDEFDKIKAQITELCGQLEEMDSKYNEIEKELESRQNIQ